MNRKRVAIVGVGAVGASAAYALTLYNTCDEILLYDIDSDMAFGKAIDISQSAYYGKKNISIGVVTTPQEIQDCDIVVIAAGVPRRSDMTRADLLGINATITKDIALNVKIHSPNAIIICVSNPLDIMTYVALKETGFAKERVIGMGGALDSARMAFQIAHQASCDISKVKAMVIGEHGEYMMPLTRFAKIDDMNLEDVVSTSKLKDIVKATRQGGAQIVSYLGTSAYYTPGRSIALMVEAILNDTKEIIPVSVMLDGEYGHEGVTIGMPCKIGSGGAEQVVQLDLNEDELELFSESCSSVRKSIETLQDSGFFETVD